MNRRSPRRSTQDQAEEPRAPQTPSLPAPAEMWQTLQQSIGNAAVSRLQGAKQQAAAEQVTPVDRDTQARIDASRGGGETPAPSVQASMQPAFGPELQDVRIHTDAGAGAIAKDLHARAFTQGRDVFFAPGQYDPASVAGQHVIAHELTHALHGTQPVGAVHCIGEDIPMPYAPGERYDEGPPMSLADPGGGVSMPPEYGASEGGTYREMVGGKEYAGETALEWELGGNYMQVTVPINFTGEAPDPAWFPQIRSVWNHFDIVNTETGERVILSFVPQESSSGYTVNVVAGTGRANESTWYLGDARPTTAPHEFGHMLGLMDEYQVTAQHYEGITGQEAPEGDYLGGKGTIDEVAGALRAEIIDTSEGQPQRLYKFVQDYGINQGSFAQAVADSYRDSWGELITDLVNIQSTAVDPKGYIYWTIEAFSYSSNSIMGTSTGKGIDHDHGAMPRHVRRFADIVASAYGGTWRPEYAY